MRILPVTAENLPALSRLGEETFTETFGHLYPSADLAAFLRKFYSVEELAAEIADPAQMWRMAFADDGQPAAYLQLGPVSLPHPDADPARHGEMRRLYVAQNWQGKGLGKALLALAMDWLAETYPASPQWIGVWSRNFRAQNLYAQHGFVKAGDYRFAVGNTLDDEFILRRTPP